MTHTNTHPQIKSILFYIFLPIALFFSCGSQSLDSSQESREKVTTIRNKIDQDLQALSKFSDNIKHCKPGRLTITGPLALQNAVQNYLNADKLTEEETEKIFHQYDITYVIVGMRGNQCHYTLKTNIEPNKVWNCRISAQEMASFSNFFKAVSEQKTSMTIPSDPFASHNCHLP